MAVSLTRRYKGYKIICINSNPENGYYNFGIYTENNSLRGGVYTRQEAMEYIDSNLVEVE